MKNSPVYLLLAFAALTCLSGCGWATHAFGQTIGTGFGPRITVETPPETVLSERWSGCCETVYVADPDTGVVRKLRRNEQQETTQNGRPGTGSYGDWTEAYCEVPGTPSFGHGFEWPKLITKKECQRLLGEEVYAHFAKQPKASTSKTYNFTGYPFSALGHRSNLDRELWLTLPAVKANVKQTLTRTAEDTGRIIGDVNAQPPKTEIYRYTKEPTPLRDVIPAERLELRPPVSAPKPAKRGEAPDGAGKQKVNSRPAFVA